MADLYSHHPLLKGGDGSGWGGPQPLAALGAVTRRRASEGSGLAAARARLYVEGDTAAGAGLEVGAATGALKELLRERPASVSDDDLDYLLRQSPEDCREAREGMAAAAENEEDAAERARFVFLARVAELRAGAIVVD